MLALQTEIRLADITACATADAKGKRPHLSRLLDRLAEDLPALSNTIADTYFSHTAARRVVDLVQPDIPA